MMSAERKQALAEDPSGLTRDEERMLGVLLNVAANRSLITYGELARLLGYNIRAANVRSNIGTMLGAIGEYSWHEWGVLPNALAVLQDSNLPAGGFNGWMRSKIPANGQTTDAEVALKQQRRVHNYFAR